MVVLQVEKLVSINGNGLQMKQIFQGISEYRGTIQIILIKKDNKIKIIINRFFF